VVYSCWLGPAPYESLCIISIPAVHWTPIDIYKMDSACNTVSFRPAELWLIKLGYVALLRTNSTATSRNIPSIDQEMDSSCMNLDLRQLNYQYKWFQLLRISYYRTSAYDGDVNGVRKLLGANHISHYIHTALLLLLRGPVRFNGYESCSNMSMKKQNW
jgi:hypothetical protein